MKTIAVLFGGTSEERPVSIKSAQSIIDNLDREKHKVLTYDFPNDLDKFLADYKKIDVAFPVFHGKFGEDGVVQGFLETLGVKYTFSDVYAQAVGMNKKTTKLLLEQAGIKIIPEYTKDNIEFPVVIKPNDNGSSFGIYIINNQAEFDKYYPEVLKISNDIIIEKYIQGREFTSSILGNDQPEALPIIEIIPKNKFFDYESKYSDGGAQEICPAEINDELAEKMKQIGLKAHQTLRCRGLSRTDFILGEDSEIYTLEINTIPGQTTASLVPKAAKAAGYTYPQFLDKLIEFAEE
jgi:D-alanine-D-alanine ligase